MTTYHYGAWSFLLASLAYIVTIPLPSFQTAYGVVGIIATTLTIPGILALRHYFERYEKRETLQIGVILMLTGGLFINTLYLTSAIESDTLDDPMNHPLITSSIALGNVFFLGIFLFILAARRHNILKPWINWVGIIGFILVLPWFGFPFVPMMLKGIGSLGFMLILCWMVMISLKMIRNNTP